jgi:hypothetical protein
VPLIAAVSAGILAAGCGSNSPTTSQRGPTHALAEAVAFAQCMRTHGAPSFADPHIHRSAQGVGISQGVSAATANSPKFGSAQRACQKLAPPGSQGPSDQPVGAALHAQLVRFAGCLRSHGVSAMPDPAANGVFNLPPQINQNTPAFQSAIKQCLPNGMPLSLNQGP